jgi:tetratricopeptide (TPR) repeat protein
MGVALIALVIANPLCLPSQEVSAQELYEQAGKSLNTGDTAGAIKLYKELLEIAPDQIEARTNLGVALAREGRYGDAIEEYRKALAHDLRNQVVLINLALALYKQGDFNGARGPLSTLHKLYPDNSQALYLLVDCDLRLGQFSNAIALAEAVYEAHPEDPAVEYMLGTALIQDGQTQRGAAVIDRILRNGDSAAATLLMGASQYAAGDYRGAAATLKKALDLNPALPGGWTMFGRALLKDGDNIAAKEAFERAHEADPNDFDACLYLGGLLRHDGDNDAAAPYLRHAMTLRPDSAAAQFQMGALDAATGHPEQAQTELEAIVRQWPDFVEAHVQLARLYARSHRLEDSERERQIVLDLNEKARSQGPQPEAGP